MGWIAFWALLVFVNLASCVGQMLDGRQPWFSLGALVFTSVVLGTYLQKKWDES